VTATITIDQAVIASWLQPGGMIDADMERRAKAVVFEAQIRSPVVTGALRASGRAQPAGDVQGAWDAVFAIYYAWFVDRGTIYMDPRYYLTNSLGAAIR
jgi:hypothetical protein